MLHINLNQKIPMETAPEHVISLYLQICQSSMSNDHLIIQPFRINTDLLENADEIFSYNEYVRNCKLGEERRDDVPGTMFPEYSSMELQLIERFQRSTNFEEALVTLEQMWRDMKFCDLILVTDQSEYLAHRIVFAYHSKVLR